MPSAAKAKKAAAKKNAVSGKVKPAAPPEESAEAAPHAAATVPVPDVQVKAFTSWLTDTIAEITGFELRLQHHRFIGFGPFLF
jgi:hypothetical protein